MRDVSFDIGRARTLALVGESGCGKTTLGKALVQLLRAQTAIRGQALLEGRDLFELHGKALLAARRDIQIIFQDPFASLNPRLRVAELLEEGLQSLRPDMDAAQRRARIDDLIDRVGLGRDALQRQPHEFSGGQRQRIAIARALAVQPKLLVCDEPTSALDVSVQAQILNLLRELQRDLGLSYLFITHNIGVVEYIADEVAVMRDGALVEQGPCVEVLARPQHAYTRELLAAVPRVVATLATRWRQHTSAYPRCPDKGASGPRIALTWFAARNSGATCITVGLGGDHHVQQDKTQQGLDDRLWRHGAVGHAAAGGAGPAGRDHRLVDPPDQFGIRAAGDGAEDRGPGQGRRHQCRAGAGVHHLEPVVRQLGVIGRGAVMAALHLPTCADWAPRARWCWSTASAWSPTPTTAAERRRST